MRGIVDHQLNYSYPESSGTKDVIKINKGKQPVKGKGNLKQRNPCKKSSSAENKLSKSACEICQCNSSKPGPSHYYVDFQSSEGMCSFIVLIVSKTLKNNMFAKYYFITIGSVLLVGTAYKLFFLIICILVSPFLKVIILKIFF